MSTVDWLVLLLSLALAYGYGVWAGRYNGGVEDYLLAGRSLPWYQVGLSVMATQASAITFISAPGQAYSDGMRFIQFYFGLPLAVIVLCVSFVPNFTKLRVYTAYEYLEQRFGAATRLLGVILFLFLRALSTAISLYAPSLILSYLLKLPLIPVTVFTGLLVIAYTVTGGAKSVSSSQTVQMIIILGGLALAAYQILKLLPHDIHFYQALQLSAVNEKLNITDFNFNLHARYTVWSGLIGGFFLQLSYFGTDQSQVGRYLTGSSARASKMGLILNGIVKIPLQFAILFTGVLVFIFFQFKEPPVSFKPGSIERLVQSKFKQQYEHLSVQRHQLFVQKKNASYRFLTPTLPDEKARASAEIKRLSSSQRQNTAAIEQLISKNEEGGEGSDSNYVFLSFVLGHLPRGTVGIIISMVFLAGTGAIASALNSMASSSVIDLYRRWVRREGPELHYLRVSRVFVVLWGCVCTGFAVAASQLGNLLEAVNQLGSLFYGTILGIFLCAFYVKKVTDLPVFLAALCAEVVVVIIYRGNLVEYLWLNVIGAFLVVILAMLFQFVKVRFGDRFGEARYPEL